MSRGNICRALAIAFFAMVLSGCATYHSSSNEPTAQANGALRSAMNQMGKCYATGGCSPSKGFDCSGLVYWAYRANGVKVPRVTTDQARAGREVSTPLVGDIMVFRTGQSGTGLHTGLYAGGSKFVHSPKPGARIRLDSVKNKYGKQRLVSVRRVSG